MSSPLGEPRLGSKTALPPHPCLATGASRLSLNYLTRIGVGGYGELETGALRFYVNHYRRFVYSQHGSGDVCRNQGVARYLSHLEAIYVIPALRDRCRLPCRYETLRSSVPFTVSRIQADFSPSSPLVAAA